MSKTQVNKKSMNNNFSTDSPHYVPSKKQFMYFLLVVFRDTKIVC